MFSLSGKMNIQIPCSPSAMVTLINNNKYCGFSLLCSVSVAKKNRRERKVAARRNKKYRVVV